MSNSDINELRHLAIATDVDTRIRLAAIDKLASLSNTYGTSKFPVECYSPPNERARKFIRLALRRLLKSKNVSRKLQSSVRRRLLILKGIWLEPETKRYLFPPIGADGKFVDLSPPKVEKQPIVEQPTVVRPVNPKVAELQAFIASVEEESQ